MLFSREIIKNRLLLFCGVIPLLIFTAGCGGDSKSGPTGPGGGSGVLFQDNFSGAVLSNAWTTSIVGGTAVIDAALGQPAPSLHIQSDSGALGQSKVTLFQPYSSSGGVSFSVMVKVENPGRGGGNTDGIDVFILDQASNNTGGVLDIRRSPVVSSNFNILYYIHTPSPSLKRESNIGLSPGFHEFRFTIFPDGTTKWFRDGVQVFSSFASTPLPVTEYQLWFEVRGIGSSAHYDNVVVSR